MNQNILRYSRAWILALGFAAAGHAAVIYSAAPDHSGGADMNCCLEADRFTLGGATTIQQITFWSAQTVAGDYAGSIQWSFAANTASAPGATLASGTATPSGVATAVAVQSLTEFSYSFAVNVPLSAGTYWLVLHNGPNNTAPATDFFWEYANGNAGNSVFKDINGGGWLGNFTALAFRLDGTPSAVPEPSTFALMGLGLLATGLVRRFRKN